MKGQKDIRRLPLLDFLTKPKYSSSSPTIRNENVLKTIEIVTFLIFFLAKQTALQNAKTQFTDFLTTLVKIAFLNEGITFQYLRVYGQIQM